MTKLFGIGAVLCALSTTGHASKETVLNASTAQVTTAKPRTVMVLIDIKAGQEKAFQEALKTVVQESRKEPHALEYRVHQSQDNPSQYMLYETWSSDTAHKSQFEKPYIIAFSKAIEVMLSKPYEVFIGNEIMQSAEGETS